ncbi:alpha/beta hydrolase fold domain-containing protein [Ligilactobacillus sp. LYQ139]
MDEYSDITYYQAPIMKDLRSLRMQLLVPAIEGPKPAILYFPGGGFTTAGYHKFIQYRLALAQAGFVVAAAEYRPIPDVFPTIVKDGKHALQYLHQNAEQLGVDRHRIATFGDSAGGYLAQLIGVTSRTETLKPDDVMVDETEVAAIGSLYGFADLGAIGGPNNQAIHDVPTAPETILLRGVSMLEDKTTRISAIPNDVHRASPLNYVTEAVPPVLLMHGTSDRVVDPTESLTMYELLKKVGCDVTYTQIKGAGHGTVEWYQEEVINNVVQWFIKHLM